MELKQNCRYGIVVPTSMGIRLTPAGQQPTYASDLFSMQATSAESNVATICASLGVPVKALTTLIKDDPISLFIRNDLARRGIEVEARETVKEGPWGVRHQINFSDTGFGSRGPRVSSDRAGEVGRELSAGDFDLERLFAAEGVQILHMSGLISAISENTARLCLDLARAAKKNGTLVSFDLNYRASFWKGREEELRETFTNIALMSDILIGNEEDFQQALGVEGPALEEGVAGNAVEQFKAMIGRAEKMFPGVRLFANTLREVVSANEHLWGALVKEAGKWHHIEPRPIRVLDRIGGGDAFVGGLLYGILRGWGTDAAAKFGWAAGAMAVTLLTDYVMAPSEDILWDIWHGNARVKR